MFNFILLCAVRNIFLLKIYPFLIVQKKTFLQAKTKSRNHFEHIVSFEFRQ